MTKLPLLAGAFMMSTILSPIGAIDVNIPSADSKISKTTTGATQKQPVLQIAILAVFLSLFLFMHKYIYT